jgi:hypothetical protein
MVGITSRKVYTAPKTTVPLNLNRTSSWRRPQKNVKQTLKNYGKDLNLDFKLLLKYLNAKVVLYTATSYIIRINWLLEFYTSVVHDRMMQMFRILYNFSDLHYFSQTFHTNILWIILQNSKPLDLWTAVNPGKGGVFIQPRKISLNIYNPFILKIIMLVKLNRFGNLQFINPITRITKHSELSNFEIFQYKARQKVVPSNNV